MAWDFADGFDLYAASADMYPSYWDSGTGLPVGGTGRFTGSKSLQVGGGIANVVKSSGANDAVHHIFTAFMCSNAPSGSSSIASMTLSDSATAQCTIVFKSDGSIVLQSGALGGTVLATYSNAWTGASTWYGFEFEVVINNTTGSFKVRRGGSATDDFSATGLNTRPTSSNNYANKLTINGANAGIPQFFDDFYWRSGSSTGSWLGELRCYTRMPVSDSSVTFLKGATITQSLGGTNNAPNMSAGQAWYTSYTPSASGTVGSVQVHIVTGYTGNMKCALFAMSGAAIGSALATANVLVNPVTGLNTMTFASPPSVTAGTVYAFGIVSDTTCGVWEASSAYLSSTTSYASFPVNSPSTSGSGGNVHMIPAITPTSNFPEVNEAQQDGLSTYVYSSNVGDVDQYGIAAGPGAAPGSVVAVVSRAYMEKSDTGTRTASVKLTSGGTAVESTAINLDNTAFKWAYRLDLTDPNTGSAWVASAVDAVTIGPKVVS